MKAAPNSLIPHILTASVILVGYSFASSHANPSECKLPAIPSVSLSSGFGFDNECVPSTGEITAFMFFVDFPDRNADETPQALQDVFLPGGPEWYATSSFGQVNLNIKSDTSRFYRMPNNSDTYEYQRGLTTEAHRKYIQDALDAFSSKCKHIKPVDVLYVVATKNATAISFSPTFMESVTTRSGEKVAKKAVTFGYDAFVKWGYKVMNHESGHTMCLADYYPLPSGETGKYVGGWSLMGYISGESPDYFAWDKWRLGWIKDEQVDCVPRSGKTKHTLSPMDMPKVENHVQAVVIKKSKTSALVAEVRSSKGVNEGSCSTGVLLYTVATDVESGGGPIVVLDANPSSEGCDGTPFGNAPLRLDGESTYASEEFGVTIKVVGQDGDNYSIEVEPI